MKRLFAILLMFAFIVQLCIPLIWMGSYQMNKQAWSISFCENQDKPEMDCKAKCYLNKKIKESQSEQTPDDAMINVRIDFFFLSDTYFEIETDLLFEKVRFNLEQTPYSFTEIHSIFRPPIS